MLLTPTFIGSLIAGVACWLLFCFGISHVDSIPYLNQYLSKKMIMDWIRKNPQLSLILTEAVNVLLHGVGTASAMLFTRSNDERFWEAEVQKVDIAAGKEMRVSHSNYRVSLTRIVGKSLACRSRLTR